MESVYLGLDIGGTNIKALAFKPPNGILSRYHSPSNAALGPEHVRSAIKDCIRRFDSYQIQAIGMGCAGSVEVHSGVVRSSPNFMGWKDVPLKLWAEEDFGRFTSVHNDANCAVFAEWKLGAAKGSESVVLLTLGTGIGGGLILAGKLYTGSTGTAGELGHLSIHADGKDCVCGNRGCFERYCSASALVEACPGYSAKEIVNQRYKDPFKNAVNNFMVDLKIGLTGIANIFDPDVIVLGGAVSLGIAHFIDDIMDWVRNHAFPSVGARVKVLPSHFGHQSGALGAALLSMETING